MKLGKYQHYKGGIYVVIGISLCNKTKQERVIYYRKESPSKWYDRPIEIFNEYVENYAGVDDTMVRRFEFIGEDNELIKYYCTECKHVFNVSAGYEMMKHKCPKCKRFCSTFLAEKIRGNINKELGR